MLDLVCYLDLDGVLVDFVGGALKHHNLTLDWSKIQWDFHKSLPISQNEFWKPLGYLFWASLDWTVEGKELLAGLEDIFGSNIVLVSSPCETVGCVDGKIEWIKRELPKYARRFFIGPQKHLIAGPGKVLVDDSQDNVDKFAAHGGLIATVPRPWNRFKGDTNEFGQFDAKRWVEYVKLGIEYAKCSRGSRAGYGDSYEREWGKAV